MAKFEFKKDTKKEIKKPRPVKKTEISKPQETYSSPFNQFHNNIFLSTKVI